LVYAQQKDGVVNGTVQEAVPAIVGNFTNSVGGLAAASFSNQQEKKQQKWLSTVSDAAQWQPPPPAAPTSFSE
jgi:hypothetical protein